MSIIEINDARSLLPIGLCILDIRALKEHILGVGNLGNKTQK